MTILRHVEVEPDEVRAYLKQSNAARRAAAGEEGVAEELGDDENGVEATITAERYAELGAYEQFVLTVTENGFGKRTSAYEYRQTNRGGQGIIAITTSARNGNVVASFPIDEADQIMLVTDQGQMIRCPVNDVRVAGRNTQGVTLFKTAPGESVVSVERVGENSENGDEEENE